MEFTIAHGGWHRVKIMAYTYFDGRKSITFDNYPPEAWEVLDGPKDNDYDSPEYLFKRVPWLGRAVSMRSDAVAAVPFILMKGDKEVDNSEEWANVAGVMVNPKRLIRRIESSLCLFGRAYLLSLINAAKVTKDYRYIAPQTIKAIVDSKTGEISFTRKVGAAEPIPYTTDRIVYFWLENDPTLELGEPTASPALLALSAAGALMSMDNFVTQYFKRGAIKAQLLAVKGNPPQEERNRLLAWWKNLTGGKGAWKTEVVNADTITPVQIGDGLEGLQDTELTSTKREDICTAFGIPKDMLFSDAATFATAQQSELNFLNYTVIPETELIEDILNTQIYGKLGYRWKFQPQTIDSFQEDETRRATAYATYTGTGMLPSFAAQILGIELPEGKTYEELDAMVRPEPIIPDNNINDDLAKWYRKAVKAIEKGTASVPFTSIYIPDNEIKRIQELLLDCVTVEDVNNVFKKQPVIETRDFSDVTRELKRANDLLDRSTDYMHIMKKLTDNKVEVDS